MAYCIYLRKSRADLEAEARGEGETLARHKKALLELSVQKRLDIAQIYHEIVSGETISSRPVMQQLLAEVALGRWQGVLVMEVERLARGDTMDQGLVAQTFQLSGTKIITPLKTYDPENEFDEEYFEFGLFMSRREYKTINRRLQRGRTASVMEGKYVGNQAPYGYLRKKLEHEKGFTLAPNPEQADTVKLIFDLYTQGEPLADGTVPETSMAEIARKLNNLGISTAKKGSWNSAVLRSILCNPVYAGKIRWNARPVKKQMLDGRIAASRPRTKPEDWILAEGLHGPLIDTATWELAQRRLAAHSARPGPKSCKTKNALAGLIVCGICGRKMVRRPYQKANRPAALICPTCACRNVSAPLPCVEERVLAGLQRWLENYTLPCEQSPFVSPNLKDRILKNAQDQLQRLKIQREKACCFLEQGTYTTEIFSERIQSINQKIDLCQEEIRKTELELQRQESSKPTDLIPDSNPQFILSQYRTAQSPAEKNALLKSVMEKAVYTKTVNGRWHNSPDEFELVLYPKLPHRLPVTDT